MKHWVYIIKNPEGLLYKGITSDMATSVGTTAQGSLFHYDQLNRLTSAEHFSDLTTNTLGATANPTPDQSDHYSSYIYDSNGNIMALHRIGDAAPMDELTYTYAPTDNRLQRVDDIVGNSDFGTDHDDMGSDFAYDHRGNLINDPGANIANILWHPNGKLNAIIRDGANDSPTLVFSYDGLGNRVRKVQVARDASGNTLPMAQWDLTYYIRDAQGNHLTTIARKFIETDEFEATDELNITETVMYGSDRLGVRLMLPSWQGGAGGGLIARQAFTHSGANTDGEYQAITPSGSPVYSTAPEDYFSSLEGAKHYELKNHLGNVLATVSDKRDVEVDGSNNVQNYTAKISDLSFYYPFGSLMPGLSDFGGEHWFGFNGQEKDNEVRNVNGGHIDFKHRPYNPNLGRFLKVDPLFRSYPFNSTYAFAENDVIRASDLEGREKDVRIYQDTDDGCASKVIKYSELPGSGGADHGPFGTGLLNLSIDQKGRVTIGEYERSWGDIYRKVINDGPFETTAQKAEKFNTKVLMGKSEHTMTGKEGFNSYTSFIGRTGQTLQAAAPYTGPAMPFVRNTGIGLSASSDLMKTAADIETNPDNAVRNLAIRSASFFAGLGLDALVPSGATGSPNLDHATKTVVTGIMDEAKDQSTK